MGTRIRKVNNGNTLLFVETPTLCPYCGSIVEPIFQSISTFTFRPKKIYVFLWKLDCCDILNSNYYITVNSDKNEKGHYELRSQYPFSSGAKLPESLNFSDRFVEMYGQAQTAELCGHLSLAGCGYRNALEVLIKDFAINILKKPYSDVADKRLWKAIEDYLPTVALKNSADVIRILGNDSTHYETRHDDLDFGVLKKYLLIFINAIDTYFAVANPPIAAIGRDAKEDFQ